MFGEVSEVHRWLAVFGAVAGENHVNPCACVAGVDRVAGDEQADGQGAGEGVKDQLDVGVAGQVIWVTMASTTSWDFWAHRR